MDPQDVISLAGLLNSPLAQRAKKYWWLALPAGYMAYAYWNGAKTKATHERLAYVAREMSPVLSLVVTALTLDTMLAAKQAAGMVPPSVQDAQFTDIPEAQ